MCDETESPWEPEPLPEDAFRDPDGKANINRAPYDQVSGVIYKRASSIKRVRHTPLTPAPDMPDMWQGDGDAVLRWLFSEAKGTEEGLLAHAEFLFLHDVSLAPQASSGQQPNLDADVIHYVITGEGRLYHRPTEGSPVIVRPLRPGDAVLIRSGEYYSLANTSQTEALRLIVLGLKRA